MKPYYENENGRLYHGDCLEILPQLEPVDLVLTDPPYKGLAGGIIHLKGGVCPRRTKSITIGDPWNANLDWLPLAWEHSIKALMVFCTYHMVHEIPPLINKKPLTLQTWHKRNANNQVMNVPRYTTEFIWIFQKQAGLNWRKIKTGMWDIPNITAGCISTGERLTKEDGTVAHPTQKPLMVILNCLAVGGESVLDPFIGSGTTAVACERLKRKWIGIEIEEKYCEIAVKRIEHEREQLKLF